MTELKFKIGDKWKRRDGKIVEICLVDENTCYDKGGHAYCKENGRSYHSQLCDLVETATPSNHTIANFQTKVFEFENNPNIASDEPIQFPLADLAAVARKLYAYEKFISELQETLKDGDEKRRMLAQKIEML
jgi:hypothetical protein